jgi:predicted glutamine amidotransferase
MCRFLVAVAAAPFAPDELLGAFTEMAEASRSPDGDRQGDGWGVAWLDGDGLWQRYRALVPIWEDRTALGIVPTTRGLAVHARSASFPGDRGKIEQNEPFLLDRHAFVFNGMLSGVSLPGRRDGEIGAQRIATLLGAFLRRQPAPAAVTKLLDLLETRSRGIPALDLAIAAPGELVALSRFEAHAEYYQLHHYEGDDTVMVCSQPLGGRGWQPLPTDGPIALRPATAR